MRLPESVADLLIEREAYRICHLFSTFEFVRFCTDRRIHVDHERLRKLERLSIFMPILRIYQPDQIRKVEYIDGGARYRDFGPLKDGEIWTGDTRTELADFGFSSRVVSSWREHGFAWDPRVTKSPHLASIETEGQRHEAYYSRFQIDQLDLFLKFLTLRVQMEWSVEDDGVTASVPQTDRQTWIVQQVQQIIEVERKGQVGPREVLGPLCQVISDRYYPKTQTDERRFILSGGHVEFDRWDWYDYARNWDALSVVKLFDLTREQLKRMYESLSSRQHQNDPVEHWHPLVRFISIQKRERLKGDALKAMTLREMAQMLRMLHRDAFGEVLPELDDVGRTIIHKTPDINPAENPLRALELVANDFGVNPKPQVVLFVEGTTEEKVIPIILDKMFGAGPNVIGIEIVNMGGVTNAAGGKENPFSALWRLIDYLHHHQTIAVVLMDNEGFAAKNIKSGLPKAASIHLPDRRATRAEYVKVWNQSFELDNFSNGELARALNSLGKVEFSPDEIAPCRNSARKVSKHGKTYTIGKLFRDKTGLPLDKPALGSVLVDLMFDPAAKRSAQGRPIVRFLAKVVKLAARNYQPVTQAIWEYNQRTGYFGTLRPGAAAKRKDPFGRPRRQKQTSKSAS